MSYFIDCKAVISVKDLNFYLLYFIILSTYDTYKWIYLIKYFLCSPSNSYKINFFEPRVQLTVSRPKPSKTPCFNTQNDKKMTPVSDLSTDLIRESLTRGNGCQGAVSLAGSHIASRVKGCESPELNWFAWCLTDWIPLNKMNRSVYKESITNQINNKLVQWRFGPLKYIIRLGLIGLLMACCVTRHSFQPTFYIDLHIIIS